MPPASKVLVAHLDAEDVYWGTAEITPEEVTSDHVPLPNGCDLPPGRYKWDKAAHTFVSLSDLRQRAVEQPVALNALAWALLALSAAGSQLPAPCLVWLDWYIDTIDFLVAGMQIDQVMLVDYKHKRGHK